jgi:hypothetical protein
MADLTVTKPYAIGGRSIVRANTTFNLRVVPFTFVPATSYTTNGDTIATADMPIGSASLVSEWAINCVGGYVWRLDVANKKLLAYVGESSGVGAQADSTANLQTSSGTAAITLFFLAR